MYTFTAIYMHELFCNIRLLTYIMHKIHYRDKYTYVCRYLEHGQALTKELKAYVFIDKYIAVIVRVGSPSVC